MNCNNTNCFCSRLWCGRDALCMRGLAKDGRTYNAWNGVGSRRLLRLAADETEYAVIGLAIEPPILKLGADAVE